MAKVNEWKTQCKKCKSEAFYYPAKLLLENYMLKKDDSDDLNTTRDVDVSCTGEDGGVKHTCTYKFPKDFTKN